MTTLNEAREAIYKVFLEDWGNTTVITADNEAFDSKRVDEWTRISVRHRANTQQTLGNKGNRKFTRLGAAFIEIYVLINRGTARSDVLTTKARNVFEGERLTGTTVRFLDVNNTEPGVDDRWYRTVVEATFEYVEIK